ncbi:MAG: amino acid permease [Planctomycetaceae bacterium]
MTTQSSGNVSGLQDGRPGLRRALGPGMALAMVVGNVIGSGIFLKPSEAAIGAGSFGLIISAWILGGLLCLLGALCFAELAVMLPQAGGLYIYLREAYGRPVAFLFGWTEFVFGRPASIGALAAGTTGQIALLAGWTEGVGLWRGMGIMLSLILVMATLNVLGVVWGGTMQGGTTLIKVGFLLALALLPLWVMSQGEPGLQMQNLRSTRPPAETTFSAQFAVALLAVMWAYNGWHGITPVAEEVRDPQRNILLALFGGIGLLIFLYVSVNIAYHGVLSMDEVAEAGITLPQAMAQKLLNPISPTWAKASIWIVSAAAMCSMLGAMNSNLLNGPRVSFAMGRDDVFFRPLGNVHARFHTPATAIVVQSVMSGVLIFVVGLLVERVPRLQGKDIFGVLTDFVVFSGSIFYMLAVGAVIILRWRDPDRHRPFRTPGYPLVPILYLIVYTWFLYYVFIGKPDEATVGVILVLLGLPVFFVYRRWARRNPLPG